MKPLITCEHVDFGYENHDAVIDLNLEIYPGDYLCVVGENGSGKSTLVKGLLGLLKPTSGTIRTAEELKTAESAIFPSRQRHSGIFLQPSGRWCCQELWEEEGIARFMGLEREKWPVLP